MEPVTLMLIFSGQKSDGENSFETIRFIEKKGSTYFLPINKANFTQNKHLREIKLEKDSSKKKGLQKSPKSQMENDGMFLPDLNAFVTVGERRRRYNSIKKRDSHYFFAEDKSEIEEIFLSQINSQGGDIVKDKSRRKYSQAMMPAQKIDLLKGYSFAMNQDRQEKMNENQNRRASLGVSPGNKSQNQRQEIDKSNIISIPLHQENEEMKENSPKPDDYNSDQKSRVDKSIIGSILSEDFELRAKKLEGLIENDKTLEKTNCCIVCQEKIPDCVFEPCGHGGVCYNCCDNLLQHKDTCPLCRVVRTLLNY